MLRPLVFAIRSFLFVSVSLFRLNSTRRGTVTFVAAGLICRSQVAGRGLQVAGCRSRGVAGRTLQVAGRRLQVAGRGLQVAGCRSQVADN